MALEHKPHLTRKAHTLIQEHFSYLDIKPVAAIDATCGNGFDTLFLSKVVSEKVYAFDIQEIAIKCTLEKLQEANLENKVELIKSGHENLSTYIKKSIDIIMFNFGYLPQANKSITTMTETSLRAIDSALDLLTKKGILSMLCYPGHTEGKKETSAIASVFQNLSEEFSFNKYLSNYPTSKSPILYLVTKI